jgi:hypothetical protein
VTVRFEGMSPWGHKSEIIECTVESEVLDLHNRSTVEGVAISYVDEPSLAFRFVYDDGRRFSITFCEIAKLRIIQEDVDAHVFERSYYSQVSTFDGLDFDGCGELGSFEVRLLPALLTFLAGVVQFSWSV